MWAFRIVLPAIVLLLAAVVGRVARGEVVELAARDTLTVVEMDHGDVLNFQLLSGRVCSIVLEESRAAIVERVEPGGIVYRFSLDLRIDGQPMTLRRYVCSQECFYEPYVVDGVRIWPDTVRDVFDLIPIRYPRKGNLQCLPRKNARLALQDATLRICPQQTRPWIQDERNVLDVRECYNGDDCYLGPYLGQACHVGMDINHAKGNPLFAPIDFDTQAYFNSLAAGDNNNRWRGIRRWANGDVWALQSHHLIELTAPQGKPLAAGTMYATTAGVHVGSHQHTHFEFKIAHPRPQTESAESAAEEDAASIAVPVDFDDQTEIDGQEPEVLHLDPWIIFWQVFEDRKARNGEIRAAMKPLGPTQTGCPVSFSAEGSRGGSGREQFACWWTFGDGGCSRGPEVNHVFARPGVHPVTLLVDDGTERAKFTQHIVVSGQPLKDAVLALACEEPAFGPRAVSTLDVYGQPVSLPPRTLRFVARGTRPRPRAKTIEIVNLGGGKLPAIDESEITCEPEIGWLDVTVQGIADRQRLRVAVDASGLRPDEYSAVVSVAGASGPQSFRVELNVLDDVPPNSVTIDNGDAGFYATPYFWVGHRFCRCANERRGHGGFYLTNGARAEPGQFARFTPDLRSGRYEVSLSEQTPFSAGTEFDVRVRHRHGEQIMRLKPTDSCRIGSFEFDEGADGFVQIEAGGSTGLVIADAVLFRPE